MANFIPTIEQTAAVINAARSESEEQFNGLLCLIARQYGEAHLRAAHELAHDQIMLASGAERGPDGSWYRHDAYRVIDGMVGEWVGGMYRFYCTRTAWSYSPAARSGAILAGA